MHFGRRHLLINRRHISGRRREVDEGPEALVEPAAGSLNAFGRSSTNRRAFYYDDEMPFDDGVSSTKTSAWRSARSHTFLTGSYKPGSSK